MIRRLHAQKYDILNLVFLITCPCHAVSRAILLARATSSGDVATHPLIKVKSNFILMFDSFSILLVAKTDSHLS